MNTDFRDGPIGKKRRPGREFSPAWNHLAEAMMAALLGGFVVGVVESVLSTPEKFMDLSRGKILSSFFLPSLINITPFVLFNGILLIISLAVVGIWRGRTAGRCSLYYRLFNLLLVAFFLVEIFELNRNNHIVTLVDRMSCVSYVVLSLGVLLVFLLVDSLLLRMARRNRIVRYILCLAVPVGSILFLLHGLFFKQATDRVAVAERSVREPIPANRPENIILITIDTQRADFLGCYGNESVKTPNIDRLAREGVRFDHCIVHAPMTLPSHTSILTSTYPEYNGVRDNSHHALGESIHTLAEVLKENGYETAAFVSSLVLREEFGLSQGFEHYEVDLSMEYLFYRRFFRDSVFSKIFLSHFPFSRSFLDRWVEPVTNRSISWIAAPRDKPFFAWIHYFNPHAPYAPPFPYAIPYLARMTGGEDGFIMVRTFTGEKQVSRRELEWDKALYLGEITYTDYNIRLLLETMERLGLIDHTLIVLTADHGEAFGENGDITHGKTLYDTDIRVPLIFSNRNRMRHGSIVGGLCESVDIMPTILEFVRIEGASEMQGKSLFPHLLSGTRLPARNGFTETMGPEQDERKLYGVVEDDWKYIYTPWGATEWLFHLSSDPAESRNRVDDEPERARRMREKLESFVSATTAEEMWEPIEIDAQTREHLRALGYIQ